MELITRDSAHNNPLESVLESTFQIPDFMLDKASEYSNWKKDKQQIWCEDVLMHTDLEFRNRLEAACDKCSETKLSSGS